MKIAIYKDTFANNRGADIAVKNLAAGLEERGHAVTLFDKAEFDAKVRGDYDVIISTGTNEILDLAQIEGLPPIVQQFHTDPRYPFRHWIKRWRRNRAIKAALKKASSFQVLSQAHVKPLQKILGCVDAGRIFTIGNWSAYEGGARTESVERNVILCPGAINKDKNQTLIVDAFAEVADGFPDWQVHIYGKGKPKDEAALAERIEFRKLGKRILLKGYADLSEPYANCAFVAFPSKTEGFGMVILDAAMFSKPSLVIKDWIGLGKVGGGIVTESSVTSFADGFRRLMESETLRHEMGSKAREFCIASYFRDNILDKWEALLRKAAEL